MFSGVCGSAHDFDSAWTEHWLQMITEPSDLFPECSWPDFFDVRTEMEFYLRGETSISTTGGAEDNYQRNFCKGDGWKNPIDQHIPGKGIWTDHGGYWCGKGFSIVSARGAVGYIYGLHAGAIGMENINFENSPIPKVIGASNLVICHASPGEWCLE